ncbi:MAG: hypothetical protein WCP77_06165 [Roseococcus sp.]
MLLWPAFLNQHPILFVDSMAYLRHGLTGDVPWDKTMAYGPFLALFHQRVTLWGPILAQALILSHLLWLTQRLARGEVTPGRHLLVVLVVAAFTAAPWFTSLLMPDIFAPILVLALYLLGYGGARLSRAEVIWLGALAAFAVAVHLSHLPLALALIVLVALMRRRLWPVLRCGVPILAALVFLLGSNALAVGRATLSPHGSVFLLARWLEDGPALWTLRARCPEAGWYLCGFIAEMPMDSDHFLWSPASPVNRLAAGGVGLEHLSPEASAILSVTLRVYPWQVVRLALANGAAQLVMTRLDDSFDAADLNEFSARILRLNFPPGAVLAFETSGQMRDGFAHLPFIGLHQPALLLAALGLAGGWWRLARSGDPRDGPRLALILCILVGISGNALATGALSKPHHRYQARIAWLLPLAAILAIPPLPGWRTAGIRPAPPPR